MCVVYTVTMYQITLSEEETRSGIKTSIRESDQSRWEKIDHIEFPSMSNARFAFEGRRDLATICRVNENEFDAEFFTLCEEQKTEAGIVTRVNVLDIAVPKKWKK